MLLILAGSTKLKSTERAEIRAVAAAALGPRLAALCAPFVGPAELALGAGCLVSWGLPRQGLLGAAATLLLGLGAVVWRLSRRPDPMPCRCFGPSAAPLSQWDTARNVILGLWAGATVALSSPSAFQPGLAIMLLLPAVFLALLLSRLSEIRMALG